MESHLIFKHVLNEMRSLRERTEIEEKREHLTEP